MSFIRRSWDFTKRIYRAARDERATPREIGWAVGIGVFVGCTPALGFHGLVALGAATLFRKNRLFCWIGSRMCNMVTLPFIVLAEVEVARLLRTGHWVSLDRNTILDQAPSLIGDWILGLLPVGGVLGVAFGLLAVALARARDRRVAARQKLAAPDDLSHNHPHARDRTEG
jgi:uncharacterized protein (DUF2062 family)